MQVFCETNLHNFEHERLVKHNPLHDSISNNLMKSYYFLFLFFLSLFASLLCCMPLLKSDTDSRVWVKSDKVIWSFFVNCWVVAPCFLCSSKYIHIGRNSGGYRDTKGRVDLIDKRIAWYLRKGPRLEREQ